jgi:hypothetical protein
MFLPGVSLIPRARRCTMMLIMSRRRSPNRTATRMVGAAVAVPEADRFYDLCLAAGTTQSDVVRTAMRAFMSANSHLLPAAEQEVLPLREAS